MKVDLNLSYRPRKITNAKSYSGKKAILNKTLAVSQPSFSGLVDKIKLRLEAKALKLTANEVRNYAHSINEADSEKRYEAIIALEEAKKIQARGKELIEELRELTDPKTFKEDYYMSDSGGTDWEWRSLKYGKNGERIIKEVDDEDCHSRTIVADGRTITAYITNVWKGEHASFRFDEYTGALLEYALDANIMEDDYKTKKRFTFRRDGKLEEFQKKYSKKDGVESAQVMCEFEYDKLKKYYSNWKRKGYNISAGFVQQYDIFDELISYMNGYSKTFSKEKFAERFEFKKRYPDFSYQSRNELKLYLKEGSNTGAQYRDAKFAIQFVKNEELNSIGYGAKVDDWSIQEGDKVFTYLNNKPFSCIYNLRYKRDPITRVVDLY